MKVGFIGVGFMGRHMAMNVLRGGHELTVFDIRKEAADDLLSSGAVWANSPREVAEASELVFTSLPMPQHVELLRATLDHRCELDRLNSAL